MSKSLCINDLPKRCLKGFDYANQVALGEIDVCDLTSKAIDRFFKDLDNSEHGGPYVLDYEAAERVMRFTEHMPHIKGPQAGQNIVLGPWQAFIYLNVFGWKVRETGHRRFRKVYTEIPRGNGKSTMVAPPCLYMLSADKEGGAEIYSAAVTRDQARIVFNTARAMAQRVKPYLKLAGVEIFHSSIAQDKTASMFQPLSADARTLDGLNVHLAVLDELAQHKTREVHDVIETGTGKRNQPLMWMITTAGPDQGNIGFEIHDYAKKLLEGAVQDDSFFSVIYTIDPEDDWTQPKTWAKANPNWGVSVMPDTISQLANRAIQVASFQNSFKMKHLNVWTNANVGWLDSMHWARQAMPYDADDFIGEECMVGLDLTTKIDIGAAIKIFRRPNTSEVSSKHPWMYYLVPRLYLPEAAVKSGRNANYAGWVLGGHIIETPGEVIDFEYIEEDLKEDLSKYVLRDVAFDPWQAMQLAQRLQKEGLNMVEFPAQVRLFTEPMKEFEALIRQGLIFHDNNPAFNWMISNLVVKEDRKGNIFPRKDRDENKIDGPVAAIMALARWLLMVEIGNSVYNDENDDVIL